MLFNGGCSSRARHHRDCYVCASAWHPWVRRRHQVLQVAPLCIGRVSPDLERPRLRRIRRVPFDKAQAEPIEHLAVVQFLCSCKRFVKELRQVYPCHFRSSRLKLLRRETALAAIALVFQSHHVIKAPMVIAGMPNPGVEQQAHDRALVIVAYGCAAIAAEAGATELANVERRVLERLAQPPGGVLKPPIPAALPGSE